MRIFWKLLGMMAILLIISCQFSENIYMNEDGSGRIELEIDCAEFLNQMGGASQQEKKIDSIISMKELLKSKADSISKLPKETQDQLKALESVSMKIAFDSSKKLAKFSMYVDFDDINEAQDMYAKMNEFNKTMNPKANKVKDPVQALRKEKPSEVTYSYEGNKFIRKTIGENVDLGEVIDRADEAADPNKEKDELAKVMVKQLDSVVGVMRKMYDKSNYKLNYHFAKKIKSVSNKDAVISKDGKQLTIEMPFADYMVKPNSMDLEVVFED